MATDTRDLLFDLSEWLKRHLATNIINRSTGNGGHNGHGSSWSAVAIPEWDVRQRLEEIEAARGEMNHKP